MQERETTVLKNPREGLSVEKQKRGRKSKQPVAKLVSKPLRSVVLPPLSKLTLRGPDRMLNPPTSSISKTSRKRMREDDSSPILGPVQKRRLVRTQFGKRTLDSESEYGEPSHNAIADEGGNDEDEASIADEDSTSDAIEEEVAEEEEEEDTESTEELEDEVLEEDLLPVRRAREVPMKKGIARKSRKGSHRTEVARRVLAEERAKERARANALASGSRSTRSNSSQVTPVPRTRSTRGTPDERARTSLAALEDARATPRSGLLSKVARKGRK